MGVVPQCVESCDCRPRFRGGGEFSKPWSKTGAGGQPTAGQLLAFAKQTHPKFSPAQLKTLIGQSKK
eukprot:3771833-Amphidinium_carterae.1